MGEIATHNEQWRSTAPAALRGVVAIPACNEAERIEACIAALAAQRDVAGRPITPGSIALLVFANNCRDDTATIARAMRPLVPFPLYVIERMLPAAHSSAGWARKHAMDEAACLLEDAGAHRGAILTTDADSLVGPTWVHHTVAALTAGADSVAGYIDAQPLEILRLGAAFLRRGRWEDTYLAACAEIDALCDPLPHDPWPNHHVSSGASLAVTLAAYRAIGGLPPKPVGEDAALTAALEDAGFAVRHSLDVCVTTSCRFDGRATGGAADTMKLRHDQPDAVCDAEIEPALAVTRRALWRHALRQWHAGEHLRYDDWRARLRLAPTVMTERDRKGVGFASFWRMIERESPVLRRDVPLRPSDLPRQIERATMILRLLRQRATVEDRGFSMRDLDRHAPELRRLP